MYTRFLDLQKAEEQAREAQIETALEKVRAHTMGMHSSEDLGNVALVMFEQMSLLGGDLFAFGIVLCDKHENMVEQWHGLPGAGMMSPFFVPVDLDYIHRYRYNQWKAGVELFSIIIPEDYIAQHFELMLGIPSVKTQFEILNAKGFSLNIPTWEIDYGASFKNGYLLISSLKPFAEEKIFTRFAKVFEQAYTRFLDLQKAEAQVKEAQIEGALERVRSKALAMQKSEDLSQAVAIVFEELEKLKLGMLRCGIGILNKEKRSAAVWTTTLSQPGQTIQVSGDESMDIHPLLHGAFNAWERQEDFAYTLEGEDLNRYYEAITHVNFKLPDSQSLVKAKGLKQYYFNAIFQAGGLFAFRETPFPDEAIAVMKRFAGVFNLTYTRFNDLQLAEAQAKQAVIEEQKLREEKKRSDALLLNILPEEIASELKQYGKSYARKHEEVTILFCDIVGFSTISEDLSAEELVTQLDECFRAFDKIIEKHGLEKIKTVGDAYICACGLPTPVFDNAAKTVKAARDMLDFLKGFNVSKRVQDLPAFEFRIGIHTGPVITGVVGLKKFTYDIWGDAVNMAARMEQHGEAGRINISGNTFQLIKDKISCCHRGKIHAKNKGEVDMYFVESVS